MSRSSGSRPHFLQLQRSAGKTSDGDGGYSEDFATFSQVFGSIEPATQQRLDRFTISGSVASATHIVTIPFIEGVQIGQRVLYAGRRLDVLGLADPEERHIELVLVCQEVVSVAEAATS